MATRSDERAGSSQTLARGLRVLRALADHPEGLSVSELAAALETNRPGIYRLLGPLTGERLVVRGAGGRYTLGLGLLELASRVQPRLQEVAAPALRALADELDATAALTVREGDEAVVALVVEPHGTHMRVAYRAGFRHPVGRGAPGIALAAAGPALPDERPEVTQARTRGWSFSRGELLPGATGVAVPLVVPAQGLEASISAVWLEARDEQKAASAVARAAAAIAAAL
jgi:DNA-binding IclR family transcriptional regulator